MSGLWLTAALSTFYVVGYLMGSRRRDASQVPGNRRSHEKGSEAP